MEPEPQQGAAQNPGELLVFLIRKDTKCSECGKALYQAERRREREAEVDQQFVKEFADAIVRQFPGSPSKEASRIASHACRKYSGRVGRSAAAKRLDPESVRLAVIAAVRHQFTNYDTLLLQGLERHEARALVSSAVERKLGEWSGGEHVTEHRRIGER